MRVHFIGNVCNNHYVYVKGLRKMGVDARLFLTNLDLPSLQNLPEAEDCSLIKTGYPDWIYRVPRIAPYQHPYYFSKEWLNKISEADIIHCHAEFSPSLSRLKRPFVIHPYGADFFIRPFMPFSGNAKAYLHPRSWRYSQDLKNSYEKAKAVLLTARNPLWSNGYNNLLSSNNAVPMPLAIDVNKFSYGYKSSDALIKLFPNHTFFILQTARHAWRAETVLRDGGNKGNDILIKEFSRFCKKAKNALLIFVSGRGGDEFYSRKLIEELGIESNVAWMPRVSREELIPYLKSADIFIDTLNTIYGSAGLEAMSCGLPLLANAKTGNYLKIFGYRPPLVHVDSREGTVLAALELMYEQPKLRRRISEMQRDFIEKYHAEAIVCEELVKLYRSILAGRVSDLYVPTHLYACR